MFVYCILIMALSFAILVKKRQVEVYKQRFNISAAITITAGIVEAVFFIYLIGSLMGELIYGVHSKWVWYNVAYKTRFDLYLKIVINALFIVLYAIILVPGPAIMLCGLWDNSQKIQSIRGLLVTIISTIAIIIAAQNVPSRICSFLVSIAASMQAVMGVVVCVSAISPVHKLQFEEADYEISIRDKIKKGLKSISDKYLFCVRFVVYLFKLNTEEFRKAKKYIIIATQVIALLASMISSLQQRIVEFEQLAYRMRVVVSNRSQVVVILPVVAIIILLCIAHSNKLYKLIKYIGFAETTMGVVNLCTYSASSYIRLFGPYAWIYLGSAIVSTMCCATIGTTITSDHSFLQKAMAICRNKIASSSIFDIISKNTEEARDKYPMMNSQRRINFTLKQKQKIKQIMSIVIKCCFGSVVLCIFLLLAGGLTKIKILKSYHGSYGTSYDVFSANTGGYVLELLNLRELQAVVGDWVQFARPIARYMPEILVIGGLLFSFGLMLNNWKDSNSRPITIGWLIMTAICYGLHFFSIQVNSNYADWVSVREYLFPSLANRDKFWSAVIVNNGRFEGYFYKREIILKIACIVYALMLFGSLIYWAYIVIHRKRKGNVAAREAAWPEDSEKHLSQEKSNVIAEDEQEHIEFVEVDQNGRVPREIVREILHEVNTGIENDKTYTKQTQQRRIVSDEQKQKVRSIVVVLVAIVIIAVLIGQFRNVTYERKYTLTEGYNRGYIELHEDGTYYMSLGWYGSLEGTYRSNGHKLWIQASGDENQSRTLEFEVHDEYLVITTSGFDNEKLYRDME